MFSNRTSKPRPFVYLDMVFSALLDYARWGESGKGGEAYQGWQPRSIGLVLGDEQSTESRFRGSWRPWIVCTISTYVPDVEETKWGKPNALFLREFVSKAGNYAPIGFQKDF
jgi:hypothetical protein